MSHQPARVLASPTRANIVAFLHAQAEPCSIKDVAQAFDLHPNVVRTHLTKLIEAGYVLHDLRKQPEGGRPYRIYFVDGALPLPIPLPGQAGGQPGTYPAGYSAGYATYPTTHPNATHSAAYPASYQGVTHPNATQPGATTQSTNPANQPIYLTPAHHGVDALCIQLLMDMLAYGDANTVHTHALSVARALGHHATMTLSKPTSGQLEDLVTTMLHGLRTYHPSLTLVEASRDWVTVANVGTIVSPIRLLNRDLATVLERGLLLGAADGLGASIVLDTIDDQDLWHITRSQSISTTTTPETMVLDTTGLANDEAVVAAMRAMTDLRAKDVLSVITRHIGSPAVFARWADRAGHSVLAVERTQDHHGERAIRLLIAKGAH